MHRKLFYLIRLIIGIILILAGIISGFIPIVQGWLLILAGLLIIGVKKSTIKKWILKFKKKFKRNSPRKT